MRVQEALESKKKLIKFLKSKGLLEEKGYIDEEYMDGTFLKIDERKLLVVYEIFDEEELKIIKDHFLIDRGLNYCVIFFKHKLIFFRNFGEKKHFIYSERTQDNRSKIDKLEKISESFDLLFHTKDISKRFYELFKKRRNFLVQHIENDIESTNKFLIAQKLFDRFFFIYFLCHKGLIKFDNGSTISGENLFVNVITDGDFLTNLNKLFSHFNSKNDRLLQIGNFKIYVPFLNGGLFRPDEIEKNLKISLENKDWQEIFEFLNSYHWVIEDIDATEVDEEKATEVDEEKILTPEILGHVYERSVVEWELKGFDAVAENAETDTERNVKGVFYTPEFITDFISSRSIEMHILKNLERKFEDFEDLIRCGDKKSYIKSIEILNNIKVLDPACGSGAFLIKAAEIIFKLRRRFCYSLGDKINFYKLKLKIITENIYGVDILAGAVEISKLRLWLWLIAHYDDNQEIEPLPNIEYNIMVGNSLIGYSESRGWRLDTSLELDKQTKRFEEVKKEYKRTHGKDSNIISELLEKEMHNVRSILNELIMDELISKGINFLKIKKDVQFNFYGDEASAPIDYIYKNEFEEDYNPFHWILEFSEVFRGPNPGFDIIVGNPPHGADFLVREKKIIDKFYDLTHHYESAKLFIEVANRVVAKDHSVSFVMPKSFTYNSSWKDSRQYIFDNCQVNYCIDLGKAFQDVKHEQIFIQISFKDKISNYEYFGGYLENKDQSMIKIPIDLSKSYDILFANLNENDIKIGYKLFNKKFNSFNGLFDIFRGFGSSVSDSKGIPALAGKDVNRYFYEHPKKKIKPTNAKLERMAKDKVIAQRIVAHVKNPVDQLYIKATTSDKNSLNIETVANIVPKNSKISNLFVAGILNSRFLGWYIYRFIYNKAIRNIDFDPYYINKIILPQNNNNDCKSRIIDNVSDNIDLMAQINKKRHKFLEFLKSEFGIDDISTKIYNYFIYPNSLESEMRNNGVNFTPSNIEKLHETLEMNLKIINSIRIEINNNNKEIDENVFKIYELEPEEKDIILEATSDFDL